MLPPILKITNINFTREGGRDETDNNSGKSIERIQN